MDVQAVCQIYRDSTRVINGRSYTDQQIQHWVSFADNESEWANRLAVNITYVALIDGKIVAFAEVVKNGNIEHFYCDPRFARRGVGKILYSKLENVASELGIVEFNAGVSLDGLPFFLSMGFRLIQAKKNIVCGREAMYHIMKKNLSNTHGVQPVDAPETGI